MEPAPLRQDLPAPSPLISYGLRRIAFTAAALLSGGLHAAAFVACLTWSKPASLGAVELSLDVVSIELAPSQVLEAQPKAKQQEPAPSTASVAPIEGNADEDAVAERPRETPRPEEPEPEPPVDPPKVESEPAAAVPQEPQEAIADAEALPAGPVVEKEKPKVAQPAEPERKEEAKREPEKVEKKEKPKREARKKGRHTSRARSGRGAGSSRASASAGSTLQYASYVRARVAGNKPASSGGRGRAVVAFGVTSSGGLAYVRIKRSSGSAALDHLAMGAVRGAAPFPPPPPGATRQFSIAFNFQ